MNMNIIGLLLPLLLCCVSSKAQVLSDSILIDDIFRTFHFNKPSNLNNTSSLIFILHGSGNSGKQMMNINSKIESIAESENLLLVYPDGYKHFWNECRKMANSEANIIDVNEIGFFNSMIEYFTINYQVSRTQIFVIGTSGGGHMAYKLALTMPKKFKAITAIIANLPDAANMDCVESKIPIPIMIINGTNDPVNPYNGGEIKVAPPTILGSVQSTDETFKYWANLAGYAGNPKMEKLDDADPSDGKTIEKYTFKSFDKPEITLLKVINGKHDYPNDIDVNLEAWYFFKRQLISNKVMNNN